MRRQYWTPDQLVLCGIDRAATAVHAPWCTLHHVKQRDQPAIEEDHSEKQLQHHLRPSGG
jgi:hypothetical protein